LEAQKFMAKKRYKRVLAKHLGSERGPMLVCIGGMHGNETAGAEAIELMGKMLDVEPITNPRFTFSGLFLGIAGNLAALREGVRFIKNDLNRQWKDDNVERIMQSRRKDLEAEDKEIFDIVKTIRREARSYRPTHIIVLDLHTTTAFGGIFTIASDDFRSIRIGVELHVPVITGMLKGIQGTSLHYFNKNKLGADTTCIVFESGQHDEKLSVNRAIAAITNVMSIIGCINAQDVENQHEQLLIEYARHLPMVAEHVITHSIKAQDHFQMQPGYKNFQPIERGEILAYDQHGAIQSPIDGLILMPLYQSQGDDGFFIVREVLAHGEPLHLLQDQPQTVRPRPESNSPRARGVKKNIGS
jgi:succinylglutamate desuccinylase